MRRRRRAIDGWAGSGVTALLLALTVAAGSPDGTEAQDGASVFTPRGHWSVVAARRLHAMGLMPAGYDPAPTVQSLGEVRRAFDAAAERSELARIYRDRLAEELGAVAVPDSAGTRMRATARLGVGVVRETGTVRIGFGNLNDADWTGPLPQPDRETPVLGAELYVEEGFFAGAVEGVVAHDEAWIETGYGVVAVGPVGLFAGVRPVELLTSPHGGIVFTELPPLPAVGIRLRRPVHLPSIFRAAGPVRLETFLARGRQNYTFEHPWIWGLRFMVSPHDRLNVALNRGVMLGGAGNTPLTLRTFAYFLIGKHSGEEGEFDNQVVSVSVRYRPPMDALPLSAYLEWGFDDSAGAWKDVPGIVAGVEAASLPGAPELGLGVSATWFAGTCCGNTMWYRNWSFRGGWADDGEALGHPLGGHGRELRAYGQLDAYRARLQVRPSLMIRSRGVENLLAPDREGGSWGGSLEMIGLAGPWQAYLRASGEVGETDWSEGSIEAGLRGRF